MILTKTLMYPNMLKYKSGQLYSIYKCVHIWYFEVFFFSRSVLWELVPPKLSTWKQCIVVYYPFPSETEKNSQRDGQRKGPLALPIKKLATCNQKVSTFFLWAGVNSTQLVKNLQGLYFGEIKGQPAWGPFSSPTEPFVTRDTPPPGIFQCSSNCGPAQCTWPCSKAGAALPQAKSEEIQKITCLSSLFHSCIERLRHLSTKTLISPPFFSFPLCNVHHQLLTIQQEALLW